MAIHLEISQVLNKKSNVMEDNLDIAHYIQEDNFVLTLVELKQKLQIYPQNKSDWILGSLKSFLWKIQCH